MYIRCSYCLGRCAWRPQKHDLGHEAVGVIEEIGSEVKDFKPGDKVIVPAITPDWRSMEAQDGVPMHSNGMLGGWKFSNSKNGVFAEYFHVNDADMNLALLEYRVQKWQILKRALQLQS